jgi:MFS family permease
LILSFTVATAAVGMVNASLPRYLAHLHAAGGYGIAMACVGGGAMLAGLLVRSINESRAINRSVSLGFLGMAAGVALLSGVAAPATAFLFLVLVGMLDATTEASYSTILQRAFAGRDLTAIMTVATSFISVGMVAGFGIAVAANARLAAASALVVPAAACVLAALLALPLAFRRRQAAVAEPIPTTLARGLLSLPAILETATGRTVALVAEDQGRWLTYPADAVELATDPRLRLPGYELTARAVDGARHNGVWVEVIDVRRSRMAA